MTNFMVKSGTGSGRIYFTNPATSGSGRISQKQIRYSPTRNGSVCFTFHTYDKIAYAYHTHVWFKNKMPVIGMSRTVLMTIIMPVIIVTMQGHVHKLLQEWGLSQQVKDEYIHEMYVLHDFWYNI